MSRWRRKLKIERDSGVKLGEHTSLEIIEKRGEERHSQFRLWLDGDRLFTAFLTGAKPLEAKVTKRFFESFEVVGK